MTQYRTKGHENSGNCACFPPLLGERAGVRASVSPTHFRSRRLITQNPKSEIDQSLVTSAATKAFEFSLLLVRPAAPGRGAVICVRTLNLRGIRRAPVDPDPISAGDRFTGRQRLRRYSRPAHGQQPIMASHPGGRIVRMTRIHEHGYAAQVAASFL